MNLLHLFYNAIRIRYNIITINKLKVINQIRFRFQEKFQMIESAVVVKVQDIVLR